MPNAVAASSRRRRPAATTNTQDKAKRRKRGSSSGSKTMGAAAAPVAAATAASVPKKAAAAAAADGGWLKAAAAEAAAGGGKLPVTLLSGFLGAGKTTLLKRILTNKGGLRVAVIVNDMAELNIDAALIGRGAGASLVQVDERLIALQNGCICCTLREDLLLQVTELAAERRYDLVVIESTGISEPMQVAETFAFPVPLAQLPAPLRARLLELLPAAAAAPAAGAEKASAGSDDDDDQRGGRDARAAGKRADGAGKEEGREGGAKGDRGGEAGAIEGDGDGEEGEGDELRLSDFVRLDTCVTVVDASVFEDNLHSIEELRDRYGGGQVPEGDDRTIANLLLDQVEFADVVILNKVDALPGGATGAAAARLEAVLRRLNPRARVAPTERCAVDLREVLLTGRFSMDAAAQAPGWLALLRGAGAGANSAANGGASGNGSGDGAKKAKAGPSAREVRELLKAAAAAPETAEYGVGAFVYRARRPFHPKRLYAFLKRFFLTRVTQAAPEGDEDEDEDDDGDGSGSGSGGSESESASGSGSEEVEEEEEEEGSGDDEEGQQRESLDDYEAARRAVLEAQRTAITRGGCLLRSKGFAWVASLPDAVVEWSSAGLLLELAPAAPWFCTVPEDEWPGGPEDRARIRADFDAADPSLGDRRQELVFIGQALNEAAIKAALDVCLLTDRELAAARPAEEWARDDPLFGPDD